MFYGYPISQWIGVLQWFVMIIALGTGVYFASAKATYMSFKKKNKKKIFKVKNKTVKKQVFFDVA